MNQFTAKANWRNEDLDWIDEIGKSIAVFPWRFLARLINIMRKKGANLGANQSIVSIHEKNNKLFLKHWAQ